MPSPAGGFRPWRAGRESPTRAGTSYPSGFRPEAIPDEDPPVMLVKFWSVDEFGADHEFALRFHRFVLDPTCDSARFFSVHINLLRLVSVKTGRVCGIQSYRIAGDDYVHDTSALTPHAVTTNYVRNASRSASAIALCRDSIVY